ncbi:DUF3047 domain-containing protein [Altererythrobacter arenosus]|uniref:DUF3047 domain-containing protein n=1 Tax=Altererythrobacter arenosus TaxID=3032592 RepID=A0ABY8FVY7_9SPHN|nr:DUF3047 domain-containing protein [Altererythrobacter sp. CAU 1644]WFL78400.1 DUF3047 domain-containing protein [Altererythrobacter sp. CAU 1644]
MPETKRSILRRAGTFLRFVQQQRARLPQLAAGLPAPDPAGPLLIDGSESDWTPCGLSVARGDRFQISARGHGWLAKGLGLVFEPQAALFVRIGGVGPVRRIAAADWVFEAWTNGEVEILSKGLSEFADRNGTLLPGKRPAMRPGFSVRTARTEAQCDGTGVPADWNYLWRIGEAQVFTGERDDVEVSLDASVGILQRDVDIPLTGNTLLEWDWLVESLPSALPEDLAFTHDYLSIAVEFENGRDLTYMWSAGLDEGHIFRCPLDWWCDWETHWVLRSGPTGLGQWHNEKRLIAADYREALGEPVPARVVRVWLIANSVFQRQSAHARFRNIRVA